MFGGLTTACKNGSGPPTFSEHDICRTSYQDGVPHPGTLLVDKDGVIRAKLFVDGYRERHSVDELIRAAEKLKK